MWSLFKTVFFVGLLGAAAYGVFFVPLGDATVSEHAQQIWHSSIVQDKFRRARHGMEDKLSQKLDRALANKAAESVGGSADISEADRRQLETLLRKNK